MKKLIFVLMIAFTACTLAFSAEKNLISFEAGITTAIPFYGSNSLNDDNKAVKDGPNGTRMVFGVEGDMNFNILDQFSLFLGMDYLNDFNWNKFSHANHLDYSFFFGGKVYPFSQGFDFNIAYALGNRSDVVSDDFDKTLYEAFWGNGFRMGLEYDFSRISNYKHLPVIGVYWKSMPRGKNLRDDILSFAGKITF